MTDVNETVKKSNWFARHKILSVVVALVVLVIIVAAAGGSSKSNVNTTPAKTTTTQKSSNQNTKAATDAHVGAVLNIGGSKGLAVTLQQVMDPATSDNQYITADAGKRFVAVKLQIQNNGQASYQDDANNNVTLIGSDNQSYTADFDPISGCTNFSNGEYTLAAGESATGCVVFQVPNGVKAAKVQFQTISGLSSSTGKWLVP